MTIRNMPEQILPVQAFPPAASPAGNEGYISLKDAPRAFIVLNGDNGSTVTAATVTVKQATAVAGTGEKALAFSTYYALADTSAGATFTKTTATSNTFDTTTTNAKNWVYVINVEASSLDVANNFDCIRVDVTGNANCVLGGMYYVETGYAGGLPSVDPTSD